MDFSFFRSFKSLACFALAFAISVANAFYPANAQRPRFPDPFQTGASGVTVPSSPVQFQAPAATPPSLGTPNFGNGSIINSPPPIITTTPPPAVLQLPNQGAPVIQGGGFDPFGSSTTPLPSFGGQIYPAPNSQPVLGGGQAPQVQLPGAVQVLPPNLQNQQPGVFQAQPGFQNQPVFPQGGYGADYSIGNQWPYGSNGRNWWPSVEWPSQVWARLRSDVLPRILERPRFRHTYIFGNNGNELGINDAEIATTATIPNFLRSNQALRISPMFIFHFWDGPDTAVTGVDLPSKAYSALIGMDFVSDPRNQSGIETNWSIGVYSDFEHLSSDSLRLTGTLLGWQRINAYTTAKLGIEYLDRVDTKILPAFGVFLAPNADLKLDLYFPRPKLAQRVPNVGNLEVWVYTGGEYGGGSWTIERLGNFDDQVDINEVRWFLGAEWVGPRNVTGFVEFGYVFDRELVFKSDELNKTELQDSVMVRSGFAF